MVLRYVQDETKVIVKAGSGDMELSNSNVIGNMIYGDLNGEYIQICTAPEPDGFFYGIFNDGSRLQIIGTDN